MRNIYLANIWPQIISDRGIHLFNLAGFTISGNWLDKSRDLNRAYRIIYPYANFYKAITLPMSDSKIWQKTISYILFPDACVGWDYKHNNYLQQKNSILTNAFKRSKKVLSHSIFSLETVQKVYKNFDATVVPLGIDVESIRSFPRKKFNPLTILWNHMWRCDKGTLEAFGIVKQLARKYPKVRFLVGQMGTWGEHPNVIEYKQLCLPLLRQLRALPNVRFIERFSTQSDYWQLLRRTDIGFSTSFHEGFGLSMMEQEAAGMACVVPDNDAYPEMHTGCLVVKREKISKNLESLIENAHLRNEVSLACETNSLKYDTQTWVKEIIANF